MAKFKTRARTIDMLGRQQISGVPTAISELFKNAHDAYANMVQADFFPDENLIVLRDDGIGMTEEEFQNRWLSLGTESKTDSGFGESLPPKPLDTLKRPMLGEKGIGRLAIAALGSQVLIMTRAKRKGNILNDTVVSFLNWRVFECPGLNLEEIDIPVYPYTKGEIPTREDVETLVDLFRGNLIRLQKKFPPSLKKSVEEDLDHFTFDPIALDEFLLQEAMKESDNQDVKSSLSLKGNGFGTHFFISPTNPSLLASLQKNQDEPDRIPILTRRLVGFTDTMKWKPDVNNEKLEGKNANIWKPPIEARFHYYSTPEKFDEIIDPFIFFNADDFDKADHLFDGTFDEFGDFEGTIKIYEEKPVKFEVLRNKKGESKKKTECGPFNLKVAYVQGNLRDSKLSQDDHVQITSKLGQFGGLYIYKDGIRVQPYGDTDYDFLEFEKRRTLGAGYYIFSYRRMFGYIELTAAKNKDLQEKAGREGFLENGAYRQFTAILKNFFIQLAADFFRPTGKYSEPFLIRRSELKRQAVILKERDEKSKKERIELERKLDEFFERLNKKEFPQAVNKLVDNFTTEINKIKNIKSKSVREERLFKSYLSTENALSEIENSLIVAKKSFVGLPSRLRREWELYLSEVEHLKEKIIIPAREKINSELANLKAENNIGLDPRHLKFAGLNGIDSHFENYTKILDSVRSSMDKVSSESSVHFKKRMDDYRSDTKKAWEDLVITKTADGIAPPELYGQLLSKIKADLRPLINFLKELKTIYDDLADSISKDKFPVIFETTAILEEENMRLREQYDEAIELSQLGMTVSVIRHEFEMNVQNLRSLLNRLKEWADLNPDLDKLYQEVRRNFEHLDGYLNLFTPLQKRLHRTATEIYGGDIAEYLREVFAERLEKDDITIESTDEFSKALVIGYPSTFYPVFVNLVDNAIYWLKDHRKPRIITLNADTDGSLIVADNGPGVGKRDRDAIFEAGFTRKPGGRGLGLKISRDVLRKVDYNLVLAESEGGAIFRIEPKTQESK